MKKTHRSTVNKLRQKNLFSLFSIFVSTFLLAALLSNNAKSALPEIPSELIFVTDKGVYRQNVQMSYFPGTELKFHPGFIVASTENESPSAVESRWQALFTADLNRKESYRPLGVFGAVKRRLAWNKFYANIRVRPEDPKNHTDPAYDWSKLDAIFEINAVRNEGALVFIEIGDISFSPYPKAPIWLGKPPYNGLFLAGFDGGSGAQKSMPKYYRYTTPDSRGLGKGTSPGIMEEFIYFHQAMHDHLVATGNINKVMGVNGGSEIYTGKNFVPPKDWSLTDMRHGSALRYRLLSKIWGKSNIVVHAASITSQKLRTIAWPYMQDPIVGMIFPDMKMSGTNNISGESRFDGPDGNYQKDKRPLLQNTETNGYRSHTYFAPEIPNPWNYSNVKVPQTASHILWALSGKPKNVNKDSGLGQTEEDPPGIMPVHMITVDWNRRGQTHKPSLEEWHKAIDTFGPPGTFAFPYFPTGYMPE